MQISNAISDLVLACTCFYVFFRSCNHLEDNTRLAWGGFLLPVGLAALTGTFRFLGVTQLISLHDLLTHLGGTVGVICLLVGVGAISLKTNTLRIVLLAAMVVGFALFWLLLDPQWKPFGCVSKCMMVFDYGFV